MLPCYGKHRKENNMTCEELKNKIINKVVDDSFLVLLYKDNTFVINQYIKQIAEDKHLTIKYIDSLAEISLDANSFFEMASDVLYVLHTDKLVCSEELLNYTNTIVVCKEVTNLDSCKNNIVTFDKLNKDQIMEYMQVLCPGIQINELEWLYEAAEGNIYRIYNELRKLRNFAVDEQSQMFNLVRDERGYYDLNPTTIFNFINAFIKRDKNTLLTTLSNLDIIDVEGTGLVTLLIKNIKNIIDIQTNPSATPKSTGMTDKQFNAVKWSCGKFSTEALINMFEFLTEIDYRLKSGQLELSNDNFVGYIITNMMEIGYEKKI